MTRASKENSPGKYPEPAHRYAAMAEAYIAAIGALVPVAPSIHAPFHMMVGHALELSLKALLAHQGRNEEWLMMVGHNLGACHRLALSSGFDGRTANEIALVVGILNSPHLDQRFRYPSVLPTIRDLPPSETFETLRLHLEDVRGYVGDWAVDL